ncbi:MAG: Lrp/AsnC family transcriptional regulator, partial [Candidatus Heimdallarchaeota archaeon]|nr:Lrp/AsnC family transcriptional regulator [Candidatus Heimdallarchaeota archaeon]
FLFDGKTRKERKYVMNPSERGAIKINQIMEKAPSRYKNIDFTTLSTSKFQEIIPNSIPTIIKEDITFYFQYLKNNRSKKSLILWEKATDCSDSPNSWKAKDYRPIFSFLYYDRITEGYFLPLLLKKIEVTTNRPNEISISEFNRLCRLSIVGFRPELDNIDIKILQALAQDATLITQDITDQISHSYATVYNHLQRLKAKMGLRITTRVNWLQLGVNRVFLISKNEMIFQKFDDFKSFLDGQSIFLWGEIYYLRYYFLREEIKHRLIERLESISKKESEEILYFEVFSTPISGYDFESFDIKEQRWDYDFASFYIELSTNRHHPAFINLEKLTFEKRVINKKTLTDLELQTIEGLVGNYSLSQKEIANLLGIHAPNLSIIRTKLLNENVIIPQMMINTFLPLNLVLLCASDKKEILEKIAMLLQKLPFHNISSVATNNASNKYHLFCFMSVDDILYSSLVTFLMQLMKENELSDFRLGLTIDTYFGMSKVMDILKSDY